MVPDHWSNDAMVSMDRRGLCATFRWASSDQDLVIRYIFYNENNNVTMNIRASWYLWSILSIDEDAQTISLNATIKFQWNSTSLEGHQGIRLHLLL